MHGGQFRLPLTEGLFAPGQGLMPKWTAGIHRAGGKALIVSRGLEMSRNYRAYLMTQKSFE